MTEFKVGDSVVFNEEFMMIKKGCSGIITEVSGEIVSVKDISGVEVTQAHPVIVPRSIISLITHREGEEEVAAKGSEDNTENPITKVDLCVTRSRKVQYKYASDFMSIPKGEVDFRITVYNDDFWPKKMRSDIPDIDSGYEWNYSVFKAIHLAYYLNERALLTGPPGSGKTTAIKQYAAMVRHPYMRFNGKFGIDQASFLGCLVAINGETKWTDGLVTTGVKQGYIICIDEVFKIPANIQMSMQSLYERDGFLVLDDKPGSYADKKVIPHKMMRLFCTDNSKGFVEDAHKYAATALQDSSTIDRFGITKHVDYMPRAMEAKVMLKKVPKVKKGVVRKIIAVATAVRRAYKYDEMSVTMSPRLVETACRLVAINGISIKDALSIVMQDKFPNEVETTAFNGFLKAAGI